MPRELRKDYRAPRVTHSWRVPARERPPQHFCERGSRPEAIPVLRTSFPVTGAKDLDPPKKKQTKTNSRSVVGDWLVTPVARSWCTLPSSDFLVDSEISWKSSLFR